MAQRSAVEREFYLDAHRWVMSDDSSWPFSFLNVCQTLNLAPETVREEVLGDLSLGAVGYWTRRCGRAARKSQIFLSNIFTNERTTNAAESVTCASCTNMKAHVLKLRRILRPVVRKSTYRHDPLLINTLAAFNFRPPIRLEFPGERLARTPQVSR